MRLKAIAIKHGANYEQYFRQLLLAFVSGWCGKLNEMAKNKDEYVTPVRSFTDENGNWFIEFNKKDIKKLKKKFSKKKKK